MDYSAEKLRLYKQRLVSLFFFSPLHQTNQAHKLVMNRILQEQKLPDMEAGVYRHRCILELRLNTPKMTRQKFAAFLKLLSTALEMQAHPELPEPVITSASGHSLEKHAGLEGMLFWLESGLHAYWWEKFQLLTVDMHSCRFLHAQAVEQVACDFFEVVEFNYFDLISESSKRDNPKVEIRPHERMGRGVFAREAIQAGAYISGFYGELYEAEDALSVPPVAVNHAIQFSERKWRDGLLEGIARYCNHSCAPNCGIRGLFDLVAMRDIQAGEELCWDYAMTEDSNWEVPGGRCLCGAANCRGRIVAYRELPTTVKQRYRQFTSAWLRRKYHND